MARNPLYNLQVVHLSAIERDLRIKAGGMPNGHRGFPWRLGGRKAELVTKIALYGAFFCKPGECPRDCFVNALRPYPVNPVEAANVSDTTLLLAAFGYTTSGLIPPGAAVAPPAAPPTAAAVGAALPPVQRLLPPASASPAVLPRAAQQYAPPAHPLPGAHPHSAPVWRLGSTQMERVQLGVAPGAAAAAGIPGAPAAPGPGRSPMHSLAAMVAPQPPPVSEHTKSKVSGLKAVCVCALANRTMFTPAMIVCPKCRGWAHSRCMGVRYSAGESVLSVVCFHCRLRAVLSRWQRFRVVMGPRLFQFNNGQGDFSEILLSPDEMRLLQAPNSSYNLAFVCISMTDPMCLRFPLEAFLLVHEADQTHLLNIVRSSGRAADITEPPVIIPLQYLRERSIVSLRTHLQQHLAIASYCTAVVLVQNTPIEVPRNLATGRRLPARLGLACARACYFHAKRCDAEYIIEKDGKIDIQEDDEVVLEGGLPITTRDPVAMVWITTPVRGLRCQHAQCFDLDMFLTMNSSIKDPFSCPYCHKYCPVSHLIVDELLLTILMTIKDRHVVKTDAAGHETIDPNTAIYEDIKEFQLSPSGEWIADVCAAPPPQPAKRPRVAPDTLTDGDDDELPIDLDFDDAFNFGSAAAAPAPAAAPRNYGTFDGVEVIDLT